MFNLLKIFCRNRSTAFSVNGIRVSKLISKSISGNHYTYRGVFGGFEIRFDYNDYFVNQIGDLRLLLNDVVIKHERHNITLSNEKPTKYIKKCFHNLYRYVSQLDYNSIKTILKTFQYDVFSKSHDFGITRIDKQPNVFYYLIAYKKNNDSQSNDNRIDYISVMDFCGECFEEYSHDDDLLRLMNFASHSIIWNKQIENYPAQYVDCQKSQSGNNSFYNKDSNTGIYYVTLSSPKETDPSRNISINVLWLVNFPTQTVDLSIVIYENNTLIRPFDIDIENRFVDGNIDKDYYLVFFENLFEKLLLTYFPTQELADFLHITDFNGRLTEEQYNVFSMYFL